MNIWLIISIITLVVALYFSVRKNETDIQLLHSGIISIILFAISAELLNIGMVIKYLY